MTFIFNEYDYKNTRKYDKNERKCIMNDKPEVK